MREEVKQMQARGEVTLTSLQDRIVEKLRLLPEPNLREVLNFVEFLMWRTTEQEDPVLSVAGILSGEMLSAEEIELNLYGNSEES